LAGVKVLDLSRVLAGPWATQILADLGADVLKVEHPERGDETRAWGPPYLKRPDGSDDLEESAYYLSANRNKRSAAIDFAHPDGAALIRRLAVKAHVLVENYKVGGLAKYDLDYPAIAAINPAIVYCSISGFGQNGPYAKRGGYDFIAQGMGGFMSVTGEAGGEPLRAGVAIADLSTGNYAAAAILAALRHAERTGEGQHIDIALLDTQIAMMANQGSSYLVGGVPGRPTGNRHPTLVPYTTFAVADGTVIIAVGNDRQYRALCEALGEPALATDPRFVRSRDRVANREACEAAIARLVSGYTRDALAALLDPLGVPVGPINDLAQVFADPVIAARGTLHRFERDDGAIIPSVAFPAKLSRTPATFRAMPPRTGEHTRQLLGEWLEMSEADVAALETGGAVRQR
jgi:crotonobetainyl-CoA:carnitine CoA-transferase CaiB-like acyl-CoA transferase